MRAANEATMIEAINVEIEYLVDDLAGLMREATKQGVWSMGMGWTLDRIGSLLDVGGELPEMRKTAMLFIHYVEMERRLGKREGGRTA